MRRAAVAASSLEMSKDELDGVWGNLGSWKVSLFMAFSRGPFKVLPKPSISMIPCCFSCVVKAPVTPSWFCWLETSPISYCVWSCGALLLSWQTPAEKCVTHFQSTSGAAGASCIEASALDLVLAGLLLLCGFVCLADG